MKNAISQISPNKSINIDDEILKSNFGRRGLLPDHNTTWTTIHDNIDYIRVTVRVDYQILH